MASATTTSLAIVLKSIAEFDVLRSRRRLASTRPTIIGALTSAQQPDLAVWSRPHGLRLSAAIGHYGSALPLQSPYAGVEEQSQLCLRAASDRHANRLKELWLVDLPGDQLIGPWCERDPEVPVCIRRERCDRLTGRI